MFVLYRESFLPIDHLLYDEEADILVRVLIFSVLTQY